MNSQTLETATFAAGCFWGVESNFRKVPGVVDVEAGYTGGDWKSPTYEEVCSGRTGHAEAVKITFDPAKVSYDQLLDTFWEIHNPTTLNRQGPDTGTQYRSAIFTHTPEQMDVAQASKEKAQGHFSEPIVTQIEEAGPFWRAEEYHQRYFEKQGIHHPACRSGG